MRNFFLLLTLLCFYPEETHAQITVLDTRKGLSNNWILEIMQDPTGLLWVGTGSGLNTYDGYTFKEVPAFKGMTINCLVYDSSRKCIWVGARQGLFSIAPETGRVVDYTARCKLKNVEVVLFHANKMYFGFSNGLILEMDEQLNPRIFFDGRVYHKKFYLCKHVITIGWDNYLYLTYTEMDSLITIDLDQNRRKPTTVTQHGKIWNMFSFDSLLFVNKHQLGGFIWNEKNKTYIKCRALDAINRDYPQPDFVYYRNNKLYIAYRGARSFFMIDLLKPGQPALPMPDEKEIIRGRLVNCMLEDKHGVKWLGTATGLIRIVTEPALPCRNFLDKQTTPIGVRQMVADVNNDLLISTYQGIFKYTRNNNPPDLLAPILERSIPFRALFPDSDYIYLGTESTEEPFYRLNRNTRKFEKDFIDTALSTGSVQDVKAIYHFLKDGTGLVWLATHRGLASFDPETNVFTHYTNGKFYTGKGKLSFLCRAKKPGYFWATGKDVLFLIHPKAGIVRRWSPRSIPALPADEFTSVSEAADGSVWLGSKTNGIVIVAPDYNRVSQLRRSDGLSNNEVYDIVWTDSTTAWITTFNGLCRFDLQSKRFSNYFKDNGLPDNEFSQTSFYFAPDKQLLLGGLNGVTAFYPSDVKPLTEPFNVFFRSVLKWNSFSQSFIEVIPEGDEKIIPMYPSDHLLTFELGVGDYSSGLGVLYYYRVEGLYNEWIELKDQNILRLEGLPVGSYKVEVVAFNSHGQQSSNILQFEVRTIQVFYKTWWFYLMLFSLLLLMIYLYFRWRINEIKKKQQLRTEIASNLHDEVGSLLTSISIYADNALHHASTMEEKNAKLERVFSFSRDATATMSDVLWSIDARNDYAGSLTDRIREHTELMFGPLGVEVEFDFTGTDQEQTLKPDVRQHIYLIFKEMVNNIVKHSAATRVKILYKQQGQSFELFVVNDLPAGFDEASVGAGQGLLNMQMRAGKIGATLTYNHSGNTFSVHLKKA